MRLLISLHDQKQGYALSAYLTKNGLENKFEIVSETDWSSQDYGSMSCRVWVIDEDHFVEAKKIAEEFVAAPADPRYLPEEKPQPALIKPPPPKKEKRRQQPVASAREPIGKLTTFLLVLCSIFLLFGEATVPSIEKLPPGNLPVTPFLMPSLYKQLMFDYPYAYDILDKIINVYGADSLDREQNLPPEEQLLLDQFHKTPYWTGLYDTFLDARRHGTPLWTGDVPLFEKEKKGQVWRLFTPCLLHADILHLLFNMLWLALLGRQMESRLGMPRYAVFLIAVGIFSNTAQYLMGGANFLGFSGILCGMLAFVWMRRRNAAWEGYQLQAGTIGFITFFILLMFAIQFATFIAQYFFDYSLSPGIANTAHLSGAFFGYLLAKIKFFAWKTT